MSLGKVPFADWDRVIVEPEHMDAFQTFMLDFMKELAIGRAQAGGVVYGCGVTPVSALTVRVAAGLVLFDNNQLVLVPQQDIALNAADPTNPRYDRIELAYSLVDTGSVDDIDGNANALTKIFTGTVQKNTGTAAGSPSVPAKTAGRISLAVVSVTAALATVLSGHIDQTEDSAREISALKFSDGTAKMRYNATKLRFEVTKDGTNWLPIGHPEIDDISIDLPNNQGATALSGLIFDSSKHIGFEAKFLVSRKSSSVELVATGRMRGRFLPVTAQWDFTFETNFEDNHGVTFTQHVTTGQVSYATTNEAGTSYVGKLRITEIRPFKV